MFTETGTPHRRENSFACQCSAGSSPRSSSIEGRTNKARFLTETKRLFCQPLHAFKPPTKFFIWLVMRQRS